MRDALDLFLTQRTKRLHSILTHKATSAQAQSPAAPTVTRPRSGSSPSLSTSRRPKLSRHPSGTGVEHVLLQAVETMLETVRLVGEVFESRPNHTDTLLNEMIRLVQIGEPIGPAKTVNSSSAINHRRSARLASFSSPLPVISPTGNGPPMSSPRVLQDLPSFQILLQHLPQTISGFTPFIAPSSIQSLPDILRQWTSSAIEMLRDLVPSWLRPLQSVRAIWATRATLHEILLSADLAQEIGSALEGQWSSRINEVWSEKLQHIVQIAKSVISAAVDEVMLRPADHG